MGSTCCALKYPPRFQHIWTFVGCATMHVFPYCTGLIWNSHIYQSLQCYTLYLISCVVTITKRVTDKYLLFHAKVFIYPVSNYAQQRNTILTPYITCKKSVKSFFMCKVMSSWYKIFMHAYQNLPEMLMSRHSSCTCLDMSEMSAFWVAADISHSSEFAVLMHGGEYRPWLIACK
mgnify:CR=1 FL=1